MQHLMVACSLLAMGLVSACITACLARSCRNTVILGLRNEFVWDEEMTHDPRQRLVAFLDFLASTQRVTTMADDAGIVVTTQVFARGAREDENPGLPPSPIRASLGVRKTPLCGPHVLVVDDAFAGRVARVASGGAVIVTEQHCVLVRVLVIDNPKYVIPRKHFRRGVGPLPECLPAGLPALGFQAERGHWSARRVDFVEGSLKNNLFVVAPSGLRSLIENSVAAEAKRGNQTVIVTKAATTMALTAVRECVMAEPWSQIPLSRVAINELIPAPRAGPEGMPSVIRVWLAYMRPGKEVASAKGVWPAEELHHFDLAAILAVTALMATPTLFKAAAVASARPMTVREMKIGCAVHGRQLLYPGPPPDAPGSVRCGSAIIGLAELTAQTCSYLRILQFVTKNLGNRSLRVALGLSRVSDRKGFEGAMNKGLASPFSVCPACYESRRKEGICADNSSLQVADRHRMLDKALCFAAAVDSIIPCSTGTLSSIAIVASASILREDDDDLSHFTTMLGSCLSTEAPWIDALTTCQSCNGGLSSVGCSSQEDRRSRVAAATVSWAIMRGFTCGGGEVDSREICKWFDW